jgi:hypothetical protein
MSYKSLMYSIVIILVLNCVVLYWLIFTLSARVDKLSSRQSLIASSSAELFSKSDDGETITERNVTFVGPTQTCDDCSDRITTLEDEFAEMKQTISNQPVQATPAQTASQSVREFFVPLGSGSTKEKDWTDIPGASAYIDANNYAGIKSVAFEGSMRIPQKVGKAYVRLYNKTANHPVWFSEQSTESETSSAFSSNQTNLDGGNNLYQVQMKSTIGAEILLDSSRVKIILQ